MLQAETTIGNRFFEENAFLRVETNVVTIQFVKYSFESPKVLIVRRSRHYDIIYHTFNSIDAAQYGFDKSLPNRRSI